MVTDEERSWGSLSHLSALAGLLIPFGSILAPLILWRTRGQHSAFVAEQAREALNFNISVGIAFLACLALTLIFIGILLLAVLVIYWIVMTVIATIQAGEGHPYRYPVALRLVS